MRRRRTRRDVFAEGVHCQTCMFHIRERVRFVYNEGSGYQERRVCGGRGRCPHVKDEGGKDAG